METTEFIKKYNPCKEGKKFALQHGTMAEVWENCKRPDWLFWILAKHSPLEKKQSVRLAITFAETTLKYRSSDDYKSNEAIQAAKNWLENPCEETVNAATKAKKESETAAQTASIASKTYATGTCWSVASAARAAARAASRSAAEAAVDTLWAANSSREAEKHATINSTYAAHVAKCTVPNDTPAVISAKVDATKYAEQCQQIRDFIPNPFNALGEARAVSTSPPVALPRLVRPFELGQSVDYRNHVAAYRVFPLVVTSIVGNVVTAKSEEGRTFTFCADTGVATWTENLSIIHWPKAKGL